MESHGVANSVYPSTGIGLAIDKTEESLQTPHVMFGKRQDWAELARAANDIMKTPKLLLPLLCLPWPLPPFDDFFLEQS